MNHEFDERLNAIFIFDMIKKLSGDWKRFYFKSNDGMIEFYCLRPSLFFTD